MVFNLFQIFLNKRLRIAFIFIIFFSHPFINIQAQNRATVTDQIDLILKSDCINRSSVGIYVCDGESEQAIYTKNEELQLIPASVQKLYTTAASLDLFGPDYTFETRLMHTGTLIESEIKGDLVVVGSGDPTLNSSYFMNHPSVIKEFVKGIVDKNIKKISGQLVIDISVFDDEYIHGSWLWQDIGNYFGAGIYGLSYMDNTYLLEFNSNVKLGSTPKIVSIIPASMSSLQIDNNVKATNISYDNGYIYGSSLSDKREIRGEIPVNRSSFTIKGAMPDPYRVFATDLIEELRRNGIEFSNDIKIVTDKHISVPMQELVNYRSPLLKDIVAKTNYRSINLYAEHLFKQLGNKANSQSSWEVSQQVLQDYLLSLGIKSGAVDVADGCGLSRLNTTDVKSLTRLLYSVRKNTKISNVFFESLPVSGNSGTMKYFGKDILSGKIHAKTGSMAKVYALSGYIQTKSGNELCFAFIVNNYPCKRSDVKKVYEQILKVLSDEY